LTLPGESGKVGYALMGRIWQQQQALFRPR
jgi:hypothetical protein